MTVAMAVRNLDAEAATVLVEAGEHWWHDKANKRCPRPWDYLANVLGPAVPLTAEVVAAHKAALEQGRYRCYYDFRPERMWYAAARRGRAVPYSEDSWLIVCAYRPTGIALVRLGGDMISDCDEPSVEVSLQLLDQAMTMIGAYRRPRRGPLSPTQAEALQIHRFAKKHASQSANDGLSDRECCGRPPLVEPTLKPRTPATCPAGIGTS